MDIDIQDLNISTVVKRDLQNAGFTKTSELSGHNYITLASKFPHNYNLQAIIQELNPLGYLLPPENEISILDIPISKRLYHILERNNIFYLSQLSAYPQEEILQFRNMGEKTLAELKIICQKHNIHIGTIQSVKDTFSKYNFPSEVYAMFFKNNISSLDDFNHKTTFALYNICCQNYNLTMKTYNILKKNGIIFDDWSDKYLFEIISDKKAIKLWNWHKIGTISQLTVCTEGMLKKILVISPELASAISALPSKD